jgi:hypothetical protein
VILGAASVPVNAQTILLSAVSAAEAPSPDCTIKGNINRSGRVHLSRAWGPLVLDGENGSK